MTNYHGDDWYLWESFLQPIMALMKLPHPHRKFIAARMLLFLGSLSTTSFPLYTLTNTAKSSTIANHPITKVLPSTRARCQDGIVVKKTQTSLTGRQQAPMDPFD